MARKDDSGQRAGFVTEAPGAREADGHEATPKDVVTAQDKADTAHAPEDADGPTITMQGVSGKKITGTVKVVKVRKKKDLEAEAETATEPASQTLEVPTPVAPTDTPAPTVKEDAPETPAASSTSDAPSVAATPLTSPEANADQPPSTVGTVDDRAQVAPVKDDAATQTAESSAPTEATAEDTPEKAASPTQAPRPRKIKAGDGQLPTAAPTTASTPKKVEATPRRVKRGSEASEPRTADAPKKGERPEKVETPKKVEAAKPAVPAAETPAAKVDEPKQTPKPTGPRKIGKMTPPDATPTEPAAKASPGEDTKKPAGPRKIASGGQPVMGRKIAAASDDDAKASLAATAELFAQRKAAREAARDRKGSGTGTDRRRNDRGPARGPGVRGGRPTLPGFPGDKDEDERPRQTQSPRKPKPQSQTEDAAAVLGKSTTTRRKFQSGTDDRSRHREWSENSRANRGPTGREISRNLKERANRVSRDGLVDEFDGGRRRRRKSRNQRSQASSKTQQIAKLTHVSLPEVLTVKEFAEAIKKTAADVIKVLMKNGVMATANQELDFDTATIIAEEFDITTDRIEVVTAEDILFDDSDDVEENLERRAPVVVVMGHVDHGKTSLLDYIRKAEVAGGEAGGITQHIGAYMVSLDDRKITFLDTPGHEAFTTMRARGAQATDIAILVVAADDGVMPQTIEAINHAKAADTEIIVAINKIDRPAANVDRVKQELSTHGLVAEEWGGDTIMVPVSALTGEGIEELLEMVLLTADVLDLRADPSRQAKGIIIEAKLDRSRGPLATLLVQRGTLRVGDTIVTSSVVGNVRAMSSANQQQLDEAGPSVPVEILGLPEVPEAGELFYVVSDERTARQLAEQRRADKREEQIGRNPVTTLESLFSQIEAGEIQDLNLIVKADVVGSVEAVIQSLVKLSNDEVNVRVIHGAPGAINESDVRLAAVSNAIVIGFNVRPTQQVADLAKEEGVDLRLYSVIYNAIEDVEAAMKGMLAPEIVEEVLGHAEIRETFKASSIGTIGGAYVTDGKIVRNSKVRLVRNGVVIYDGELASLRRFKDDVREVAQNYECGISLERYNDIKVGDVVESYLLKEVAR